MTRLLGARARYPKTAKSTHCHSFPIEKRVLFVLTFPQIPQDVHRCFPLDAPALPPIPPGSVRSRTSLKGSQPVRSVGCMTAAHGRV